MARRNTNSQQRWKSASDEGEGSSNKLLWGVALCLILVAGVFFWNRLSQDNPQISAADGCPVQAAAVEGRTSLSVLLDTTDRWRTAQKDIVISNILDRIANTQELDRVRIYVVNPTDVSSLSPVFDRCRPRVDSGDKKALERWRQYQFRGLLNEALSSLEFDQPTSPIIESISSVAANFKNDGSQREIMLVSDLIEYSTILNQYQTDWQDQAIERTRLITGRSPDLTKVDMTILFVDRPNIETQTTELVSWWEKYFLQNGVRKLNNKRITG